MALPPEGGSSRPEPVDGRAHLASFSDLPVLTDLAVESYYRSRPQARSDSDEFDQTALWGIQASSSVPLLDVRADFDYSLFLPADTGAESFGNEANHMLRLSLRDRWRRFDYGATLYSVGDNFQQQPLARQHLNASGLGQPGAGREVWLNGRMPELGLRPSVRHRQIVQNFGNVETHTDATIIGLNQDIPNGSVFLRNALIDSHNDSGLTSRSRWEFGASVRPFGRMVISPVLARVDSQTPLGLELQSHSTAVNVSTRLADATHLALHLARDIQETADGPLDIRAANLNLSAPLRFGDLEARGFTFSANMGYRQQQGNTPTQNNEFFSVQLRLSYQVEG